MATLIYSREQFIEELTLALARREDSEIVVDKTGATLHVNGEASVEQSIQDAIGRLEDDYSYKMMTFKQQEAEKNRELRELRIRLNNPQRIINRFKKTPMAMWG